jgi:hypothetical protein
MIVLMVSDTRKRTDRTQQSGVTCCRIADTLDTFAANHLARRASRLDFAVDLIPT